MNQQKKNRSFDVGLTVSGVALAAIIVFIILFAFIPRPGIAPSDGRANEPSEATSATPETETQRFVGALPCDDCDGIRTELLLRGDGTFRLTETYLGRIASRPVVEVGKWTTLRGNARDLDAVVYRINYDKLTTARNYLLLPDGNIKQIDENQEEFPSAENYTLEKQ